MRTLTAHSSRFGQILFDGKGFVLYAFTKDPRGRSACYGACAAAWPPYLVSSAPRAAAGTKKAAARDDPAEGREAAGHLRGRPLYYYVGDRSPYEIRCQNVYEFGGLWLVARPNGTLVR